MSKCKPCDIDIRDSYSKNIEIVQRNPQYANFNGELTLDAVDVLIEDFNRNIVHEVENNQLDKAIKRFGAEEFDKSVKEINNFVKEQDLTDYPQLAERMKMPVAITNLEVAEFYKENILTPSKVTNSIAKDPKKFLGEMNCFFMGSAISAIMGGFCSTLKNVFGAAGAFFDLIGQAGALIDSALKALDNLKNLKNPLEALFEKIKVQALLEALKDMVINAIKAALKCVIAAIENFKGIFDEVIATGQRVGQKLVERAQDLKDKVSQTFSEENQETLLRKIEGTIDYAVNKFANPGLAEIEFLAARVCGMAAAVEDLINGAKLPLDRFAEKVADTFDRAKSASAPAKAESVAAGAIRLDDSTRQEEINNTVERCQEAGASVDADGEVPPVVNAPSITPDEIEGLPGYETLWSGADSRVTLGPGLGPNRMGADGWYGLKPEARVKLFRLQEELGVRLQVNSGYRSPEYNANLNPPGATRSKHMSGTAIDITFSGFNSETRREAAAAARRVGFKGLGYYNSFLHVDLGPARHWYG